jgi:hypothetical protein
MAGGSKPMWKQPHIGSDQFCFNPRYYSGLIFPHNKTIEKLLVSLRCIVDKFILGKIHKNVNKPIYNWDILHWLITQEVVAAHLR